MPYTILLVAIVFVCQPVQTIIREVDSLPDLFFRLSFMVCFCFEGVGYTNAQKQRNVLVYVVIGIVIKLSAFERQETLNK